MKKVLFAAFAGICILSSIMATTAGSEQTNRNQRMDQILRDTIPGRKSDTSSYPKRDTTSMPHMIRGLAN
jgi:hypothetical protein